MHINAVTICVDYADFARHSLPANKRHFDAYTVVSAPDDFETQALCGNLGISCVLTSGLRPYDGIAKARAINLGIGEKCGSDRWIALVDADTVLPAHTRRVLERIGLEEPCLYGMDREPMTKGPWIRRGVPRPEGPIIAKAPFGVWRVGHENRAVGGHWGSSRCGIRNPLASFSIRRSFLRKPSRKDGPPTVSSRLYGHVIGVGSFPS